jgi:hypothetical protein
LIAICLELLIADAFVPLNSWGLMNVYTVCHLLYQLLVVFDPCSYHVTPRMDLYSLGMLVAVLVRQLHQEQNHLHSVQLVLRQFKHKQSTHDIL